MIERNRQKVGIVYSPGYGVGWSTCGDPRKALDQELALAIENKESTESIQNIVSANWPNEYAGALEDLEVLWVEEGTVFLVEAYEGHETVVFAEDMMVATAGDPPEFKTGEEAE